MCEKFPQRCRNGCDPSRISVGLLVGNREEFVATVNNLIEKAKEYNGDVLGRRQREWARERSDCGERGKYLESEYIG